MRSALAIQAALAALAFATTALAGQSHFQSHRHSSRLTKRHGLEAHSNRPSCVVGCTTEVSGDDIDYIIVGGGTAGLAMAGRLSEDDSVKVLVIEAGPSGYPDDAKILVPNGAYYDSSLNTKYDWNYTTTPQPGLNGREAPLPRGRALGGSSAINGLYYVRHGMREGAALDHIAREMATSPEVSMSWSWSAMKMAMNAAVEFTDLPGLSAIADGIARVVNLLTGIEAPIKLGFPNMSFAIQGAWAPAFDQLGVARAKGPYDGNNLGAFIAPTTIDAKTWQRSFSRTAYLDNLSTSRRNLQVLTGHTVTRIHFTQPSAMGTGTQLMAVGVECAKSKFAKRVSFKANREVILAAGAIGSPQILQLSGVGQSSNLKKHKIKVVKDLPGVGHHLQDHISTTLSFTPKSGVSLQNASTTSFTDSAIAYIGLDDLLGSARDAIDFLDRTRALTQSYISDATADVPDAVRMGWNRTMTMLLTDLLSPESASGFAGSVKGAMEFLLSTMNDHIGIEQALQAPFSRGSVKLASSDAFEAPLIDTAYLSHPADMELLLAGHSFSRRVAASRAMRPFIRQETEATSNLTTKAQTETWVRGNANTEFHLSSSCSMLPEAEGGVVGPDLRVHGFSNMRVVDASVLPISPTTHLVSYVYGLAELASEKIKADWTAQRDDQEQLIDDCNEEGQADDEDEVESDNRLSSTFSYDGNVSNPPSKNLEKGSTEADRAKADVNDSKSHPEDDRHIKTSSSFSNAGTAPQHKTASTTAAKESKKQVKSEQGNVHKGWIESAGGVRIEVPSDIERGSKGGKTTGHTSTSASGSIKADDGSQGQGGIRHLAVGRPAGASAHGGSVKASSNTSSDVKISTDEADCDQMRVQSGGSQEPDASSSSGTSGARAGGDSLSFGLALDVGTQMVKDDGPWSASTADSGSGPTSGSMSGFGSDSTSGSLTVGLGLDVGSRLVGPL